MLTVTPAISLDEGELHEEFVRSSGPGGQNVNKVATAVQLRFNVRTSPSLPEDVRLRLQAMNRSRLTEEGELIIEARRYRSQDRNRADARERLAAVIRKASVSPKPRHRTKPTRASKERRLTSKRTRSQVKRGRGRIAPAEE